MITTELTWDQLMAKMETLRNTVLLPEILCIEHDYRDDTVIVITAR